mmetsp:Transcript_6744/g.20487  ORF Transcript_6744/g.20487 Transcript_6744/m.20487 type:complete len:462 (+) Transcript_6744:416-1801(+)
MRRHRSAAARSPPPSRPPAQGAPRRACHGSGGCATLWSGARRAQRVRRALPARLLRPPEPRRRSGRSSQQQQARRPRRRRAAARRQRYDHHHILAHRAQLGGARQQYGWPAARSQAASAHGGLLCAPAAERGCRRSATACAVYVGRAAGRRARSWGTAALRAAPRLQRAEHAGRVRALRARVRSRLCGGLRSVPTVAGLDRGAGTGARRAAGSAPLAAVRAGSAKRPAHRAARPRRAAPPPRPHPARPLAAAAQGAGAAQLHRRERGLSRARAACPSPEQCGAHCAASWRSALSVAPPRSHAGARTAEPGAPGAGRPGGTHRRVGARVRHGLHLGADARLAVSRRVGAAAPHQVLQLPALLAEPARRGQPACRREHSAGDGAAERLLQLARAGARLSVALSDDHDRIQPLLLDVCGQRTRSRALGSATARRHLLRAAARLALLTGRRAAALHLERDRVRRP